MSSVGSGFWVRPANGKQWPDRKEGVEFRALISSAGPHPSSKNQSFCHTALSTEPPPSLSSVFKDLFILERGDERERKFAHVWGEGQRGRERESLLLSKEPNAGLDPRTLRL